MNDFEVWYRSMLNNSGEEQWDTDGGDNEVFGEVLFSSWLTYIQWSKLRNSNKYVATIYFDPDATRSPKNPNGFGPLVFGDLTMKEIKDLMFAPSVGGHYLDFWAFGNKVEGYTFGGGASKGESKPSIKLEDIGEMEVEDGAGNIGELQQLMKDVDVNDLQELVDSGAISKAQLRNIQLMDLWDYAEQNKNIVGLLKQGALDNKRMGTSWFKDAQDLLGIRISSKVKYQLLGHLGSGPVSPAKINQFKHWSQQSLKIIGYEGKFNVSSIISNLKKSKGPIASAGRGVITGAKAGASTTTRPVGKVVRGTIGGVAGGLKGTAKGTAKGTLAVGKVATKTATNVARRRIRRLAPQSVRITSKTIQGRIRRIGKQAIYDSQADFLLANAGSIGFNEEGHPYWRNSQKAISNDDEGNIIVKQKTQTGVKKATRNVVQVGRIFRK